MLSQVDGPSWDFDPRGRKDTDVVRDISQQQQWKSESYPFVIVVCLSARAYKHAHLRVQWQAPEAVSS